MKRIHWLLIFIIVLAGDIAGIMLRNQLLQFIFKPLIVPVILAYLLHQTREFDHPLKKYIITALFFSWIGDLLLMFDNRGEIFFLLGLGSFLLAHIFYILYFHHTRIREKIKSNPWWLMVIVVYYVSLMSILSGYLGDKEIPVKVYGLVISFMLLLAMHLPAGQNKGAGRWILGGAALFVVSDSLLALNKFYQPFDFAGEAIIVTYGLAQLFITEGVIRYAREMKTYTFTKTLEQRL